MDPLVSKFQHYFFETGEFDYIKVRSFQETLSFIDNVSLHTERGHSPIGLDGPSVTIEHPNGTFLKLGIDYNNKFALYYLNARDQVFCRSEEELDTLKAIIQLFFEKGEIDDSFKKYRKWSFNNKKHFITNSFDYSFGIKRFLNLMAEPLFSIPVFWGLSFFHPEGGYLMLQICLAMCLIMYGANWLLLLNYYCFSKGAHIKISKGLDEFYFGKTKNTIQKYNKQDIQLITSYSNDKWSKCPWEAFYKFEIGFKDGSSIRLTSFTISHDNFIPKFHNCSTAVKHQFMPVIRLGRKNPF